jgi:hypothetical protein
MFKMLNILPTAEIQDTFSKSVSPSEFFTAKAANITAKKSATKKRRYPSTVVSGKAITEESMVDQVRQHEISRVKPKSQKRKPEPKPGTSGTSKPTVNTSNAYVNSDSEPEDSEVCCKCNLLTPQELHQCTSLTFVKWV